MVSALWGTGWGGPNSRPEWWRLEGRRRQTGAGPSGRVHFPWSKLCGGKKII